VPPGHVRLVSYSPNAVELELYRTIERSMRPVLEIQGDIPDTLVMSSVDITPGEVSVKGPEVAVMALRKAEVRSTVKEMSAGARELPVVLLDDNGEVRGLAAEPPSVKVRAVFTTTMQEARIPIRARVTGSPAAGYEVAGVTLSPDVVMLRGTREALLGVSEITINPIDITGHTESMNVDIPLESPSKSITIVGADHVNLRVDFRASVEAKTFMSVPVHLTGVTDPMAWTVSPPTVSVSVEHLSAGTALDPDAPPLELYVDATNVVASQLTLPILVRNVRGGVSVTRIEPPQVTITATDK
jgi:YbbR domain-containing protein